MPDHDADFSSRAEYLDALEDIPTNPGIHDSFNDIVNRRLTRRAALRQILGLGALGALGSSPASGLAAPDASHPGTDRESGGDDFRFEEIAHGVDQTHHVSPGYRTEILARWGDGVTPGAPDFDPYRQSAKAQLKQFGYNNDFVGYIPLPYGSDNPAHGLLCVNHEYTDAEMMFPEPGRAGRPNPRAIVDIEMACNGGSIMEIRKTAGRWHQVENSRYGRRINALDTEMRISGPAAGSKRMKTSADPEGRRVIGTLNNCAGGITPWGTYLMAEENFNKYFVGKLKGHPEQRNFTRYGVPGNGFAWGHHHRRFDINREPREANRFGWIVEVDPLDPGSTPVKRTALGRFKHEGAACIVNRDGRLVVYSGDDQSFEFLYRFVSRDPVNLEERDANRDLLDHGTLYAARFADDGRVHWLPLVQGHPGLDESNGFREQADVVIEARRAASLLGATPMDRPEDVEPNPVNGKVYVMLTNNKSRGRNQVDAVNPRAENLWGQVVELTPADNDHSAATASWELLVKAGDPERPEVAAAWNPRTSKNGWFACPDNCAIDPDGRLWICTDQGSKWKHSSGTADGLWALQTEGPGRGTGRMFFRVPVGAEMTGPCFTPDGTTLFLSVQHPGTSGTRYFPGFERSSSFEDPATRWPDFDSKMPPRPSVVVITRDDGGKIGG
jgi:secreted PhoX family phosphatase